MSVAPSPSMQPLIKLFASTLDFVTHLVHNHAAPSILIVCGTQETLLENVLHDLRSLSTSNEGPEPIPQPEHALLTPTLHLLAKATTLRMAYVPSLPHLRAYLATFSAQHDASKPSNTSKKTASSTPTMALLNPLALHRSTGDLTAQGLNRTISLAVEAAHRQSMQLVMVDMGHEQQSGEEPGASTSNVGEPSDPWDERIPLLNSSLRFKGEERAWAGKTVKIGQVAERWCKFLDCRDSETNFKP